MRVETKAITSSEDIIDSRDVIARIEYLQADLQPNFDTEDGDMAPASEVNWDSPESLKTLETLMPERWARMVDAGDDDYMAELIALLTLQDECGASDWQYGEALIRDSYFETYARDLADDLGLIKDDAQWPATCIDWEKAAEELQMDYSSCEFDGVTYWYRS